MAHECFRAPAAVPQPAKAVHLFVVSVEMCRNLAVVGKTRASVLAENLVCLIGSLLLCDQRTHSSTRSVLILERMIKSANQETKQALGHLGKGLVTMILPQNEVIDHSSRSDGVFGQHRQG